MRAHVPVNHSAKEYARGDVTTNTVEGYFSIFKRGMRHFFPNTIKRYEAEYGIRFIGWFNVTEGSEWNNVLILDLPTYSMLDRLYADRSRLSRRLQ